MINRINTKLIKQKFLKAKPFNLVVIDYFWNEPNANLLHKEINKFWECPYIDNENSNDFHESKYLSLCNEKAFSELNWSPIWNFEETIEKTINWYKCVSEGNDPYKSCLSDLESYLDLIGN